MFEALGNQVSSCRGDSVTYITEKTSALRENRVCRGAQHLWQRHKQFYFEFSEIHVKIVHLTNQIGYRR